MEKGSDKLMINVMVRGEMLRITVPRDMEGLYRRAAHDIEESLSRYRRMYPSPGMKEQILSASMLDFAVQARSLQQARDTQPYAEAVERLSGEITALLDGTEDTPEAQNAEGTDESE